jgi:transcriptional regulator with XRE-family HTH domain
MAGKPVGEIDAHIGRRIRHRRNMLNITQTELGQALGVTFQQIQKYEYGRNRVSVGTLLRLADALEVKPEYFYAWEGWDGVMGEAA